MIFQLEDRRVELAGPDHYIAHNATVIGRVRLGNRTSVWFNAVIRGDNEPITVGAESNVQDGCILHTDPGFPLAIGSRVTIGHMAMLHGCTIGDNTLIGIKAVVMNGARIGKNCIVGANALVAEGKEIPDNSLVVGSPGRVIRKVTDEQLEALGIFTDDYLDKLYRYRASFKPDTGVALDE